MIRTVPIGPYALHADDSTMTGLKLLQNGLNYESHIRRVLEEHIPSARVFLDVGANAGLHTLSAVSLNPNLRVYAFEVSPVNVALLARNVAHNGLQDRVTVIPCAVADKPCIIQHNLDTSNTTCKTLGGTSTDDCPEFGVALPIDFYSIPEAVDLVKLDVEGFELLALRGMNSLISACRPRIVFEFCPEVAHRSGEDANALLNFFFERGYRLTMLDYEPGSRRVPCDSPARVYAHLIATSKWITDILAEPC